MKANMKNSERLPNMPKYGRTEQNFQIEVCKYLKLKYPTVTVAHIPNGGTSGGKKAIVAGAIRKAMGVKAGMPDILLWWTGKEGHKCAAIELKSDKGRLTPIQTATHAELSANGVPVAVCRCISEVYNALKLWDVPSIDYVRPVKINLDEASDGNTNR